MGLLGDIVKGGLDASERKRRRQERKEEREYEQQLPKTRLQNILTSVTFVALFLAIALFIVFLTGIIGRSAELLLVVGILFIVSIATVLAKPWAVNLEKKENKKLSIVFLSLVGACTVLWIVSAFMIYSIYKQIVAEVNPDTLVVKFGFIRVSLFITIQFAIANLITTTLLNCKKSLIIFQTVMYASNLYLDFYLSYLIWCFNITAKDGFTLSSNATFLINPIVITILIIALVYILCSSAILRRFQRRKNRGIIGSIAETYNETLESKKAANQQNTESNPAAPEPTTEERLAKLKDMYEKEIITKEEYEAKRKDIIDKM